MLEADHITESVDGGSNVLDNLQTLCKPCHAEKTRAERARRTGAA